MVSGASMPANIESIRDSTVDRTPAILSKLNTSPNNWTSIAKVRCICPLITAHAGLICGHNAFWVIISILARKSQSGDHQRMSSHISLPVTDYVCRNRFLFIGNEKTTSLTEKGRQNLYLRFSGESCVWIMHQLLTANAYWFNTVAN